MVAVLLCSNLIGPGKVCSITLPLFGPLDFGAGNLFFPISYIFGDVLTEVYGYARARRAIWAGFAAMIFATAMSAVVVGMKPSADERSEEHTSELQSLMRISYAVFCLKKKKT